MKIKTQITVFLENQPGAMATVCRIMKEQKINILAFTVFGSVDHGVLRMIVDKPENIFNTLSRQGLLAIESRVIELPAENRPGILHELASSLASHGINIEYGYGSTGIEGGGERFFLQVSDNEKAVALLKDMFTEKS